MSNGAHAAKEYAARAAASSAPRGALTAHLSTRGEAQLSELLFDDPMDADGVLEASQISQTQIIERQAETIARLERHAARDKEYRTVTKVKLKEAAARLKEYRLRVEALTGELEVAKAEMAKLETEKNKALAQAQAAKKKVAAAPPMERKKPEMKSVEVQTPWKKALRTVSVQTVAVMTRDVETQAEMESTVTRPTHKVSSGVDNAAVSESKGTESHAVGALETSLANGESNGPTIAVTSAFDAIGAAVDAELEFSDDDEAVGDSEVDPAKAQVEPSSMTTTKDLMTTPVLLDDAISREIDKELEFSSSSEDDDDSSDDESDVAVEDLRTAKDGTESKDASMSARLSSCAAPAVMTTGNDVRSTALCDNTLDAVGAAIDAKLASDSDDDVQDGEDGFMQPHVQLDAQAEVVRAGQQLSHDHLPLAMPLSFEVSSSTKSPEETDTVSAAIDAELASSSEDEDEEALQPKSSEEPSDFILDSTLAFEIPALQGPKNVQMLDSVELPGTGTECCAPSDAPGLIPRECSMSGRTTEEIIREKSRTLSLSSGSSSSSSSDGESSHVVHRTQQEPLDPPAELHVSRAHDKSKTPTSQTETAVSQSINGTHIKRVHNEVLKDSRKRPGATAPNRTTTDGESDLKKRKLEVPGGSTPTPAPGQSGFSLPETPTAPFDGFIRAPPKSQAHIEASSQTFPSEGLAPRDLLAFKAAIILQAGENPDSLYVTRALGAVVRHTATLLRARCSSKEADTSVTRNKHAHKLCKILVRELSQRHIGLDLLFEGMVRVFRTPRTRHAIEKSIIQLTSLFQMVLFFRLGIEDARDHAHRNSATTAMTPEVHHVILSLRDLVVTPRLKDGLKLGATQGMTPMAISIAASSVRRAPAVSHDKGFLSHVAAFYATVCRALDRFDLPLVLIVDILSCHPNIKGLYCVQAIVQVDPRVLRKRWDTHGREQASALRAAIVHVLQVITYQSRDRQEVVYKESALTLLSSVAECIDDPMLMSIGPPGSRYEIEDNLQSFAATLWRDHLVPCITGTSADAFGTEKALELLATFHGDAAIAHHFPIKKFLTMPATPTTRHHNARIARLLGALARGTLRSSADFHNERHGAARYQHLYVEEALRWMLDVCPRSHESDDDDDALSAVVMSVADLLVGFSTHESNHKQRDVWLRELLQLLSAPQLCRLPSEPLRHLRLLVAAARPLTTTCAQYS